MSEKPFGPTAGESLVAVIVGMIIVVFCVVGFLIKAKCYYEAGKALSNEERSDNS